MLLWKSQLNSSRL